MEYNITVTTEEYTELKKQGIDLVKEIGKVAKQLGITPNVTVDQPDTDSGDPSQSVTVSKVDEVAKKAQEEKEINENAIVAVWKDSHYMSELIVSLKREKVKFTRNDLKAYNADKKFLKKHGVSKLPDKQTIYELNNAEFKAHVLTSICETLSSIVDARETNVRFDFSNEDSAMGMPYLTNQVEKIVGIQGSDLKYDLEPLTALVKSTIMDFVSEKKADEAWPEEVRQGIFITTDGALYLSLAACELAVGELQQA